MQSDEDYSTDFNIKPVVLTRRHVRLELLSASHCDDLARFNGDPELWRFMSFGNLETLDGLREWVAAAAVERERGEGIAFAIIETESNRAVGSTSLYDISARDRHLEIGRTWLGRPYWRTALNTECKFLLLQHCFETLLCHRVQLKTDLRNVRSQRAIERLGATREGILRQHMVMPDGFVRDTVIYSIIAQEWPSIKKRLQLLMTRGAGC